MSAELFEKMSESSCRVERILHLGTMLCDSYAYGSDLKDSVGDWDFITECFGSEVPEHVEDIDGFQDWLLDKGTLGFCVQFATPVPVGTSSFSWGHYATKWFYGDTFEEAVEKGIAWADANGPRSKKR